jgi:hypothetical protein
MKHQLSSHAQQELERRGIPLAVVESVLAAPGQKVPDQRMWSAINRKLKTTRSRIFPPDLT